MKNKFKILIASYNNEEWVEYNLASVLNQTYDNYEVIYVDDCSTDNTYNKVLSIVGDNPQFRVIKREVNMGGTFNHISFFDELENEDILLLLDGDDWLFDETVLEKLNDFYNTKNCWMTYGKLYSYDGKSDSVTEAYPQNTEHSTFIHKNLLYRQDVWRASHLRTFKGFLVKSIDKSDFISKIDGKLFWHAGDLALAFPCMEMCDTEKIGVVNFPTYVYNASPKNQTRTIERENVDNTKYEIEIRNKKKYKRGSFGEKLPQLCGFNKDYYHEYNTIPTKFSWVYEQSDGDFDMVLLCDPAILDYLEGKIQITKKVPIVARVIEQREYFQRRIYNAIIKNYHKFDAVLTYDRELLKIIPNAMFLPATQVTQFNMLPNPAGYTPYKSDMFSDYELPPTAFQMYKKSKLVCSILSNKSFLPGQVKRLKFIKSIEGKLDLYGRGIREIPSKLDAIKDYMFSVAIENSPADDNGFSEKIIDCFLTGTIPIYHGCSYIHEFFDIRGILMFDTEEELKDIIDNLSEEKYYSMLKYAENNYKKCFEYPLDNDMLYDMYYKKIIENGTSL
jgi:glycosyltransferase involved in cell wall biosynthesis